MFYTRFECSSCCFTLVSSVVVYFHMSERENNVYLAKLAEQAERYDEMADYMKNVAETSQELSVEVR